MYSPRISFGAASVLLLIIIFISNVGRSSSPPPAPGNDGPGIVNRTSGCEVVRVGSLNSSKILVTLRNHHPQRITAFAISVGKHFGVTEEFIYSELEGSVGIAPQEEFEKTIPIPSSLEHAPLPNVELLAVVLEDGNGDGEAQIVQAIKAERQGEAIQLKRALKVLKLYLESSSARRAVDLAKLRGEMIDVLGDPPNDQTEPQVSLRLRTEQQKGLQTAQEGITRSLLEIQSSASPYESLLRLQQQYERVLARL